MLKRLLIIAALAVAVAPAAAQEPSLDRLPIDRVVAVVGPQPILWSEVLQAITQEQARGVSMPRDSAGQMAFARQVLESMIDEELIVQKAREMGIEVPDADLRQQVDQQIAGIRANFQNETELREALTGAGFSSIEDYRRTMMDLARRNAIQRMLMQQLRQERKLPAVTVTEQEITEAFELYRGQFDRRPASVTFRQIVVPPQPGDEAKAAAKAKADSILAELRRGGDFESIARRESMDPASRDLGGDLGWARRGNMVPAFEYWLFALPPGQTSPVFETVYGYHILRVDRVQPAERKSRHILIRAELDSAAIARTRALADTVVDLWSRGTAFDSLVNRFHDAYEERGSPTPFPRDSLPEPYRRAFEGRAEGEIIPPFPIGPDESPKFVVTQLQSVTEAGQYAMSDVRQQIREHLTQEKAMRKWLDSLRRQTYVAVRL